MSYINNKNKSIEYRNIYSRPLAILNYINKNQKVYNYIFSYTVNCAVELLGKDLKFFNKNNKNSKIFSILLNKKSYYTENIKKLILKILI